MTSTTDDPADYIATFHLQWAEKNGFYRESITTRISHAKALYDDLVGERIKGSVLFCALLEYSGQLQEWTLLYIWSYDPGDWN